jgi:hypothetical protein
MISVIECSHGEHALQTTAHSLSALFDAARTTEAFGHPVAASNTKAVVVVGTCRAKPTRVLSKRGLSGSSQVGSGGGCGGVQCWGEEREREVQLT